MRPRPKLIFFEPGVGFCGAERAVLHSSPLGALDTACDRSLQQHTSQASTITVARVKGSCCGLAEGPEFAISAVKVAAEPLCRIS